MKTTVWLSGALCLLLPLLSAGGGRDPATGATRSVKVSGNPATGLRQWRPGGVALGDDGCLYVTDMENQCVRRISPGGETSEVIGDDANEDAGDRPPWGWCCPAGVAVDARGDIYVADRDHHRVRRISRDGHISTVAGTGAAGPGGGGFSGDGGRAVLARLNYPTGLAFDRKGNLYIADSANNRIRKVSPDGMMSTFAGGKTPDSGEGHRGGPGVVRADMFAPSPRVSAPEDDGGFPDDGLPAREARLNWPTGVAADTAGNVYIADYDNHRVCRVSAGGTFKTIAGNGMPGFAGDGGPAVRASLWNPIAVAVGRGDTVFVADSGNHCVRRIGPDGTITTVAGVGNGGFSGDGGPAVQARMNTPMGVALDPSGALFIADTGNHAVRRVGPDGTIASLTPASPEDGGAVRTWNPRGVGLSPDGSLYVADRDDHTVWRLGRDGVLAPFAGTGARGLSGDGGSAVQAALWNPFDVAVDARGIVYIADSGNDRVRRILPDGRIDTWAGSGRFGHSGDGGPATLARLSCPTGLAVLGGDLYIADVGNQRIRRVSPEGIITTVAGNGERGYSGDDGPATGARLNNPVGVGVDRAGNLYIADRGNQRIRRVSPDGIITTVAGNGERGCSGDGGPARTATLNHPTGLDLDREGSLYIADRDNHRIRRVSPEGIITTVAGNGERGCSGDGGPARKAMLNLPRDVAVNDRGWLFIADYSNGRVRTVSPTGRIVTLTGQRAEPPEPRSHRE